MSSYTMEDHLNFIRKTARKNGMELIDNSINMLERMLDDLRRYRKDCENGSDYDMADRLTWIAQAFTNTANNARQAEMGEVAGKLWMLSELNGMSQVFKAE